MLLHIWCTTHLREMEDPILWTLSIFLAVVLGGSLLIWVQRSYSLQSYGAALPKGSLGWPIIGESRSFLSDPRAFCHSRVKRIMGTTPEFAKFIVVNNKLFRNAVPPHIAEILGPKMFSFVEGRSHMSVKNLVVKALRAEALRTQVHAFESIILENLESWERTGTLFALDATQKLTWETSNWVLFRDWQSTRTPEGRRNFELIKKILQATVSVPVNIPGTAYAKGLKAKAVLNAHYKNLMKRAKDQNTTEGVVLDALLAARDDPEGREALKQLDDDAIVDTIFFPNFAAYDTTATTLLWILKILVDYPDVFHRIQKLLETIKWDSKGLVVAIAQHVDTGAILMQGFANREAIAATIASNHATFFSRSRSSLWTKGESSRNFINVVDVYLDCDRDSIIYLGSPDGPTCHTGAETCYYTSAADLETSTSQALTTLYSLEATISQTKAEVSAKPSWTKKLVGNPELLCSKIREEADELCRTVENNEGRERTVSEMADVLYHTMVLLAVQDVKVQEVLEVLRGRFSKSGIEEKSNRMPHQTILPDLN